MLMQEAVQPVWFLYILSIPPTKPLSFNGISSGHEKAADAEGNEGRQLCVKKADIRWQNKRATCSLPQIPL